MISPLISDIKQNSCMLYIRQNIRMHINVFYLQPLNLLSWIVMSEPQIFGDSVSERDPMIWMSRIPCMEPPFHSVLMKILLLSFFSFQTLYDCGPLAKVQRRQARTTSENYEPWWNTEPWVLNLWKWRLPRDTVTIFPYWKAQCKREQRIRLDTGKKPGFCGWL